MISQSCVYFRFEWVHPYYQYDMYRGHGSIQGMRGVRKQRQQEEQNIWQPSRARAGYVLVQQQCSDYRVSLVSCSDTKITRTAVLK